MTQNTSEEELAERNKGVLEILKSLTGANDAPEIEHLTYRAELTIEYPLVLGEETEEEAVEWLVETLEHDGEQITMTVDEMERQG